MPTDPTPATNKMSRLALLWGQAHPAVSAYVRSVVRNHHDAEDVIQTTVSRIAEHFDEYDPSKPFAAWAVGFARYVVMEYRTNVYRKPLALSDDALDALTDAIAEQSGHIDERYEALEHCIARLSDKHRAVLTQRYQQGQSQRQIADRLDVKQNTIAVMLRRIRQALAQCVADRLGEEVAQ